MSIMYSAAHLPRDLAKALAVAGLASLSLIDTYAQAAVTVTDYSARYNLLRSFDGINSGSDPYEVGVSLGGDGSLYGTTLSGGKLSDGSYGSGTVYKIKPTGQLNVLHVFDGIAGGAPTSAITHGKDGSIYGTTLMGGSDKFNTGVVYKIDPTGKYSVVHSFNFNTEGKTSSEVVLAADGSLYGTTFKYGTGVAVDPATVYKISPLGEYTVIHRFNLANHELPVGNLHLGANGNLYGVTVSGTNLNKGSVFKIAPNGAYTILRNFTTAYQGVPNAGVKLGKDGAIYGTTNTGGMFGQGTVYRVDSLGNYQIIHHFDGFNGLEPSEITVDENNNIYGVAATLTDYGFFIDNGPSMIYKLGANRSYSILHVFDRSGGQSKLMRTSAGSLYGTERSGGQYERGKVFRLKFVPLAITTLSVDKVTAKVGQPFTFKINVKGNQPTGIVTFLLVAGGTQELHSAMLNAGVVSYTTARLKVGQHMIYAKYLGDNLNASSISKPLVINVLP
jgi:uncharacterized repeat protein (TIGR03803 family)